MTDSLIEAREWSVVYSNGVRAVGFKDEQEARRHAAMSAGARVEWRSLWQEADGG